MAKLNLIHNTKHTKEEIREKLTAIMGKIEASYDLTGNWSGDAYSFKRKGLDGKAVITDHQVSITMEMGFLLGAFKGKIESEFRQRLGEGLP